MSRLILIGIWASLVTIASGYAAVQLRQPKENHEHEPATGKLETRKTKEINVPKLKDGVIRGYVVVQLSYVFDTEAVKSGALSPDSFVVDEVFRQLYEDESIDFTHLQKVNLQSLSQEIMKKVNTRLRADVLTDIAFQEFTFEPAVEAKVQK